ncbi:aminotransferase class V-fold PLP-dependent enzyme [Candidatus Bathyarchaeota archaeon]|nr:alanine--glyoxylate aminotransferase family protein [Candidatus Bathyarchaeota archaeon]NIU81004.1 aminotransferase class V-fold PLP-dependent enzyme [Candidatus Bathyarchaeota archaeon]NIV67938.1 aminotransferase class V-fold PLP-dependent enzyme [Candidatus Bathyarchaeota archaeon]NIW16052.1 aminotransferase class V-fold PLP-dependent enzyme [Candidatus Bathyarchaeota archaeon]NIW34268.1 aminotransferase class V-fold PLP-dependent enzyme [Candidatus Bathyarchaeota archaeon]
MQFRRRLHMLPGPSEPYPEVLEKLQRQVLPHYGPEWEEAFNRVCEDLKKIFQTKGEIILYPGSGEPATHMVIANMVKPGDKVITLTNGFFGDHINLAVKAYGGNPILVRQGFGEAIDPERVRKTAVKHKDAKCIFAVHVETSSGVENPIREIGEIAEDTGKTYVVDAIASLGGCMLKMDGWNIDVCLGYASKALSSIHVLSPIAIGSEVWKGVEEKPEYMKPYFMDFSAWKYMTWGGIHPVTMPTTNVLALGEAVKIALREGMKNRFERHHVAGKAVRAGVRAIGLKVLPKEQEAAGTLTAVKVPKGSEDEIRRLMMEEFNIMVGGSLGGLVKGGGTYGKGELIRIGHMGLVASPEYIVPTLAALEQVLSEIEFQIEGSGVEAAMEIFKRRPTEWINGMFARLRERYI